MSLKKSSVPAVAATALIVSCGAFAQQTQRPTAQYDYYFGGNIAFVNFSEDRVIDDAALQAFYGRLGSNFNEFLTGEVRLGFGLGDDSVSALGTRVTADLEHLYGAYVRAGFQAAEQFYPYLIAGYTRGEVSARATGFDGEASEGDFSFGIGVDYHWRDGFHVNAEYMNWMDSDGVEVTGFAIGLAKSF